MNGFNNPGRTPTYGAWSVCLAGCSCTPRKEASECRAIGEDEPAINGLDVRSQSILYFPARSMIGWHSVGICFRPCRDANANRGRHRSDARGGSTGQLRPKRINGLYAKKTILSSRAYCIPYPSITRGLWALPGTQPWGGGYRYTFPSCLYCCVPQQPSCLYSCPGSRWTA